MNKFLSICLLSFVLSLFSCGDESQSFGKQRNDNNNIKINSSQKSIHKRSVQNYSELKVDKVEPKFGITGSNVEVTITGEGFTQGTRVFLYRREYPVISYVEMKHFLYSTNSIEVVNNIAYILSRELYVIDVEDPLNPKIKNFIDTGISYDVFVADDIAYVSTNSGLKIIDVSNPSDLKLKSTLSELNNPKKIMILDNIAYVLDDNGMNVIDISNLLEPVIKTCFNIGIPQSLMIKDGIAFIGDSEKLSLVNVINPFAPKLISSVNVSVGEFDKIYDIKVICDFAYVAADDFFVMNVSNPFEQEPKIISSVEINNLRKVTIIDTITYAVGMEKILMIDITNPYQPETILSINEGASDIVIRDDIAYISGYPGLKIISIPAEIQSIQIDNDETEMTINFSVPKIPGSYDLKIVNGNESIEIPNALSFNEKLNDVYISPPSYDYKGVKIGDSISQSFIISNYSQLDVEIESVNLSQNNESSFSIHKNSCNGIKIPPSQSCILEINFSPDTLGPKNAILNVETTDMASTVTSTYLSGYAYKPINYTEISVTPSIYDFGNIDIDKFSSQTFSINNLTQSDVQIGSLLITDNNQSDYTLQNDHCSQKTLLPFGECSVQVVFSPKTTGEKYKSLSVPLKNSKLEEKIIPLYGNGKNETDLQLFSVEPNIGIVKNFIEVSLTGKDFNKDTKIFMYCKQSQIMSDENLGIIKGSEIQVENDIAYVKYNGINMIDVSDPFNAKFISTIYKNSDYFSDYIVIDNICYVFSDGEVKIIDVNKSQIINSLFLRDKELNVTNDIAYCAHYAYGLQTINLRTKVIDNIAYRFAGWSLQILDISNPYQPSILTSIETMSYPNYITVIDDIAYIANNEGLELIYVQDHFQPEFISSIAMDRANHIKIKDNIAYISTNSGIHLIDVSNPFHPKIIHTMVIPSIYDIDVVDNIIYSFDHFNQVVITSLPVKIDFVSVKSDNNLSFNLPANYTPGDYSLIMYNDNNIIKKNSAFSLIENMPDMFINPKVHDYEVIEVGSESKSQYYTVTNYSDSEIRIESVSIEGKFSSEFIILKNSCQEKNSLNLFESCSLGIVFSPNESGPKDAQLIIKTNTENSKIYESSLLGYGYSDIIPQKLSSSISGHDFGIIDIAALSAPKTISISNSSQSEIDIGTISIFGVHQSEYIIVNDHCSEHLLSTSEVCKIEVIFSPKSSGNKNATLLIPSQNNLSNKLELQLNGTGKTDAHLEIFSVEPNIGIVNSKMNITVHGKGFNDDTRIFIRKNKIYYMDIGESSNYACAVVVENDIAYVANTFNGLSIIDVKNPFQPQMLSSILKPVAFVFDLFVNNNYCYLSRRSGLHVIDISNFNEPLEIYCFKNSGSTVFHDGYLVTTNYSLLNVLDMREPTDPQIIGSLELKRDVHEITLDDITIVDAIVYLVDEKGLQLIDINKPTNPNMISCLPINSSARHIEVHQDVAYVTTFYEGLKVIDVKDPFHPKIMGSVNTPGNAGKIIVIDDIAYVADGKYGIQMIDVKNPFHPEIIFSIPTNGTVKDIMVIDDIAYIAVYYEKIINGGYIVEENKKLNIISLPLHLNSVTVNSATNLSFNFSAPATPGNYSLIILNGSDRHEIMNAITIKEEYSSLFSNPMHYNFNSIEVGNSSTPQSITITNYSDSEIEIESISITGTNQNDFYIFKNECLGTNIKSSENCVVDVSFLPKSIGIKNSALSINTKNHKSEAIEVYLTGYGYIEKYTPPVISSSSTSHDFGMIDIGISSEPQTFSINNLSQSNLEHGMISITGDHYSEFTLLDDKCSDNIISATKECAFDIVFSPKTGGNKYAKINVPLINKNYKKLELNVFGTGKNNSDLQLISITPNNTAAIPGMELVLNGMGFNKDTRLFTYNSNNFLIDINYKTYSENRNIIINNGIVFLPNYALSLKIIDLNTPFKPEVLNSNYLDEDFDVLKIIESNKIQLLDNLAYVLDKYSLLIVDIRNPSNIELISLIDLQKACTNLKVDNGFAYVSSKNYVHIIDITNPLKPKLITSAHIPRLLMDIDNNIAYMKDNANDLYIMDMTNPYQPQVLSTINIQEDILEVSVVNNIAYALCRNQVVLIDVHNPFQPELISAIDVLDSGIKHASWIKIIDNIAYITNEYVSKLYVVDVFNPFAPKLLTTINLPFEYSFYYSSSAVIDVILIDDIPYGLFYQIDEWNVIIDDIPDTLSYNSDELVIFSLPVELKTFHVNSEKNISIDIPKSLPPGNFDILVNNGRKVKLLNNAFAINSSQENIVISPEFFDFKMVQTNTSDVSQCFTITSLKDISIHTISISGPDTSEFNINYDTCSETSLASSEYCTIQIAFTPESIGKHNSYIEVSLDDSLFGTRASLTGWGYENVIPDIYILPDSHVFGSDEIETQLFTIHNLSNQDITIEELSISETEYSAFSILEENCYNYTLSPSDKCTTKIQFTPLSDKKHTGAILNIKTTGNTNSTIQAYLSDGQIEQKYRFEKMWPTLKQNWHFNCLTGGAVDNNGFIFLTEAMDNSIIKLTSNGHIVSKWDYNDAPQVLLNDIVVDNKGFVYVLDKGNGHILKFDENGELKNIFNSQDSKEGLFHNANSIAVDIDGFIYVADTGNNLIQRISPDGLFLDSIGDNELNMPVDVTVDIYGFIYVADKGNNSIKKYNSKGELNTEWDVHQPENITVNTLDFIIVQGPCEAIYWKKRNPSSQFIAEEKNDIVDISDQRSEITVKDHNQIEKWTTLGEFVSKIDSSDIFYSISDIMDLFIDNQGFLFVTKEDSIQRFSGNGQQLEKFSSYGTIQGTFYYPINLVVDKNDSVYIIDDGNRRIQKLSIDNNCVSINEFSAYWDPMGIVINSYGNIILFSSHRIFKLSESGNILSEWKVPSDDGKYSIESRITIDRNNFIYITDPVDDCIDKFTFEGDFISKWEDIGLNYPKEIASDKNGFIYVADKNFIHMFTTDAQHVNKWEAKNTSALTVDNLGFIYAADSNNHCIRKFRSDGKLISKFGEFGSGAGQLNYPAGLCVDSNGTVYVSDRNNHRIQAFERDKRMVKSKAIIVAGGGLYKGNNIWNSTQMCANYAYGALSYQGLSKETIYYLSSNSKLDLDGNSIADDVDADVSVDNLEKAINWASDADNLILYLVDHGDDNTVRMRFNEILQANTLMDFLSNISGKIIVIYDACKSGSFLSTLENSNKEQIIITSASPDQNANFISQGSISFSYFFWTHIFNGLNVQTSFELAKQSMEPFQSAMILDQKGIASKTYIGNATTVHGDAPVIVSVSAEQSITDTSSASISAYSITDSGEINRVWAVIWPPDYQPDTSKDPLNNLPTEDLFLDNSERNNIYKGTYRNLYSEGIYNIVVFALDNQGNTSIPKMTQISVKNPLRRRAIIIVGDTDTDALINCAKLAYKTLKAQLYADEDIYLMSPSSFNAVDCSPSSEHLKDQILLWSENTKDLILYMIGDEDTNCFKMKNGNLSFSDLDQWLDDLQKNIPGNVIIVYDGPNSGQSIFALGKDTQERIILSGSGINQPAYFSPKGDISFSGFFWRNILNGADINSSFIAADDAIQCLFSNQIAQLDDSGNGISNERWIDGKISNKIFIGYGIMPAGDIPFIESVMPEQNLYGQTSAHIWVNNVTTTGSIDRIWAIITPPDAKKYTSGSLITLPEIDLHLSPDSKRYETIYNDFFINGKYSITIFAKDKNENISFPVITSVNQRDYNSDSAIGIDDIISMMNNLSKNSNDHLNVDLKDAIHLLQILSGTY